MSMDRDYYVVEFFMNGESQGFNLYENEQDAEKDVESWTMTRGDTRHPFVRGSERLFSTSDIEIVRLKKMPAWHELTTRSARLEETIVQWLREEAQCVWSNVIASIVSRSLNDVYEALQRASKARQIAVLETIHTDVGPLAYVRLPSIEDRILWALLDSPAPLWSNEIASTTGDELAEVHAELENLTVIKVVEVIETRQTESGTLMRALLHRDQVDPGFPR